jgi:tetratricopeptide (TPR) repeat protein
MQVRLNSFSPQSTRIWDEFQFTFESGAFFGIFFFVMKNTIILLFSVFLLQGCFQTLAIRTMSGIMDNGFDAYFRESDLEFAREGLAGNMKLLEAMIEGDQENEHLLLLASEGYSAYALAFAEDDSVERARVFYLRGKEYGLRILRQRASFRDAMGKDLATFRQGLATLSKDDVPAVFWTAFGWGGYINITRSDVDAVADLSKVIAMMEFVASKDSGYYYGGADMFLGAIEGSMPPMLGGKPEVAKEHFEKALKQNGGKFLMTYVYYAKTYAVQIQDEDLFKSLLQKVEDASLDILPEARLPNAVAKKKAAALLARATDLF